MPSFRHDISYLSQIHDAVYSCKNSYLSATKCCLLRCSFLHDYLSTSPFISGWYTAVQILMTISFVGLIFTFISIYMYACIDRFSKERKLLLIYGILTLVFGKYKVFRCKNKR